MSCPPPPRTSIRSPGCAAATAGWISVKCTPGPPAWSTIQTVRCATAAPAVTASHAIASFEQEQVQRRLGPRNPRAWFPGSIEDLLTSRELRERRTLGACRGREYARCYYPPPM